MSKKNNKNAFKHGAYAKEILLPNESAEEFEKHLQAFRLKYNPIGEPEEAVVRDLAAIQWVKDRLNGALRQCFQHSELIVSEIGESPLDLIVHSFKASQELMTSMSDTALARVDKISQAKLGLLNGTTPEEREKVLKAADQLSQSSRESSIILQGMVDVASGLLSAARNPLSQNVDVVLKLQEQLDRRYDKAVQRLIIMKEYDRQYGAKPIEELPKVEPTPVVPDQTDSDMAKSKT